MSELFCGGVDAKGASCRTSCLTSGVCTQSVLLGCTHVALVEQSACPQIALELTLLYEADLLSASRQYLRVGLVLMVMEWKGKEQ